MKRPVRYLTDEHVAKAIATGLRRRGVDVVTIADAGLLGADDTSLLDFARQNGRVIVTNDQDFLRMASQERDHPGIAYVPRGRPIGELIRWLTLLARVSDANEMRGRVEYL